MSDMTEDDMMNAGTKSSANMDESSSSSSDLINCDGGYVGGLLVQYTPLCLPDIEKATKVYAILETQVAQAWEEESSKYEETEENAQFLIDKPSIKTRPRRNYANAAGIVTDTTLFPYHTSCYPLLQAYDGLYQEDDDSYDDDEDDDDSSDDDGDEAKGQHELQPIESNAILPASFPRIDAYAPKNDDAMLISRQDASIPGFMPASLQAISAVFWNKTPSLTTRMMNEHSPELLNSTMMELLDSYSMHIIKSSTSTSIIHHESVHQLQQHGGEEQQQQQQQQQQASPASSSSSIYSLWNTTAGNRLLEGGEWESVDAAYCSPTGSSINCLPPLQRRGILLKLLKHAMSELSRDHGLATVVLTQLLEHRDFDDVDCMQETLMILISEPIACGMPCEYDPDDADPDADAPDHKCSDYCIVGATLAILVAHGMAVMTQKHATALSDFVLHLAMREFGHLFGNKEEEEEEKEQRLQQQDDETNKEINVPRASSALASASAVEKQLNMHIKRSIVANRSMNDDDGELGLPSDCNSDKQVPSFLLGQIILGLGLCGATERTRLQALLQSPPDIDSIVQRQRHEELLAQTLDSYYNCLRAQVAIAEIVSSTLPSTERLFNLSSAIVFSITGTLILDPTSFHKSNASFHRSNDDSIRDRALYVGQWPEYQSMRVSAPLRLADHIKNSTALVQQRMQHKLTMPTTSQTSSLELLQRAAKMVCEGRPHDDIRNAVRMLFLRDLVDVRVSRLGYLDFLLWCRFEVDTNDPVQFWHEFNLPCEEDDSDDDLQGPDEEDDDNVSPKWDCDEDGRLLSREELEARFDFSLFALVCESNKPWTPESHMSYQPPFRRAVQTLAVCLHRLHLPGVLVGNIAQFLPREGWPDKRRQCWNYHCLAEHDVDKMLARHGIVKNSSPLTTTKPEASVFCKKCRVAVYCSRACREEDFKAGHKKICGRPPFCIPGKQDMLFCQVIANGGVAGDETMANQEESAATEADEAAHDDDIDNNDYGGDDGSWESIDSDDDMEEDKDDTNTNNVTRQILQFFDKYNDDA